MATLFKQTRFRVVSCTPNISSYPLQVQRVIVAVDNILTHTHTHSVGLPCMSDRSVAEASTYKTHQTQDTKKSRWDYGFFCTLYFIRTCVFVLIVLHFDFCIYLQHTIRISMAPARFFFVLFPYLFFVLTVLHFAFLSLLTTYNTTSMPPAEFELATPASDRRHTYALNRAATGIICITNVCQQSKCIFIAGGLHTVSTRH